MASTSRLPDPIQESYEWQHAGACRGVDTETFFPPETERGPRRRRREAAAKAVREPFGVWGGLNQTEREHLLRAAG